MILRHHSRRPRATASQKRRDIPKYSRRDLLAPNEPLWGLCSTAVGMVTPGWASVPSEARGCFREVASIHFWTISLGSLLINRRIGLADFST